MEKTMMLITSSWGSSKTFKMMPASADCPYNEAIFDSDSKVLAVIGKEKKDSMHMLAKLNEWGDPVTMKIGKRVNGKDYAEERKTLEAFYEYYIEEKEEIIKFINSIATNAANFDYTKFMEAKNEAKTSNILTGI
jgi:hypothetical protein